MITHDLPLELRTLVKTSVALLGQVIRNELGVAAYERIENLRKRMAELRGNSSGRADRELQKSYDELARLSPRERAEIAHAFSLMLELMNACENAYRTYRLGHKSSVIKKTNRLEGIVYVLTAHPTEARSPANINVFHEIQGVLSATLRDGYKKHKDALHHLLEVAWRLNIARRKKPRVSDEAEHIYSIVLRDEALTTLLEASDEIAAFFLRSWVGGDKDGHPGVDERAMINSLTQSRCLLLKFIQIRMRAVKASLQLIQEESLVHQTLRMEKAIRNLKCIRAGDGKKITRLRKEIKAWAEDYTQCVGAAHPALSQIHKLLRVFPALVIPLELRESSDILMEAAEGVPSAITRMLKTLHLVAQGGDEIWYARGLIISMAGEIGHIRAAKKLLLMTLGSVRLPIIPLFEQKAALDDASQIVSQMLKDRALKQDIKKQWNGHLEVMLGYSDSAKEIGVLASRLAIAGAMQSLDRLCRKNGVIPLFFHGSGGSVDRGGGSIQEQTAWWPASALKLYKATVQGEMVERSFASPEILKGQLAKIAERSAEASHLPAPVPSPKAVHQFAERVRAEYTTKIHSSEFLEIVQRATAYRYLTALRMGSRPSKRGKVKSVLALRAIPWVLCWTQTRVLFPTWWGVGTAWRSLKAAEKNRLRVAFKTDPLFRSYVKLLGFTLAKVELPIWRIYLEQSGLSHELIHSTAQSFEHEFHQSVSFVRALSGSRNLLWFRPWLGTSIQLRSPMIHPLNLIQIITMGASQKKNEASLIRETVTGISSGMMTTG